MRTNGWGWRFAWAIGAILPLLVTGLPGISLAADVHDIHAPSGGVKARPCSDCHTGSRHNSTVQSGGSGTVEVPTGGPDKFRYINGNVDADGAYNAANKECTNVDCHFGPGNAGTTNDVQNTDLALKCGTCHPDAADVDDFGYGNNTMAKINTTQWGASGHGASGTLPSGNAGADFAGPTASDPEGCAYCHDSNVPHGNDSDTLNPFRLANNNALGHGWIDVCLVCHSTNDAGYDPDGSGTGYVRRGDSAANQGKATDSNHYGGAHLNAGDGGKFCWDCHDPHGDRSGSTGNIFMVQSAVSRAHDGTYGKPAVNGTATVTFSRKTIDNLATAGYYVESTNEPATGICQACHTYTGGLDSGEVKYWRNDQSEHINGSAAVIAATARHNATAVCTECHQHKNEFAAGCADCHGNSATGSRWPDGIANNTTRSAYADDAGAHQKHVDAIYTHASGANDLDKKNNTCGWCHPGNPPPGHSNDSVSGASQAEVTRMTTAGGFSGPPAAGDYWAFGGGATATSGTAVYYKTISGADDPDGYYLFSVNQRTCLNTACHGQATPNWYGTADTTPPAVSNVLTNGTATLSITQGTAAITLTAAASDASTGNSTIVAGEYFIGSFTTAGQGAAMSAADNAFDTSAEGLRAVVNTSGWTSATGAYTLFVDAKDAANNWGPASAPTVLVSVTPQDSFTVAHLNGSAENASTGAANVVMQRLAFTASGAVDLLTVKVLGTRTGGGDVAVDVSQVKICLDDGDGTWEGTGTDTVIGSGFLNAATKDVTIDIADQAIPNGTTRYLYIVYDIAGNATGGDVLGAQLTALTYGPTDSLVTSLPLPSPAHDNKTVVVTGDTAPPAVGTLQVWFGGSSVTSIQEETATVTLTAVANDTSTGGNIITGAEYFVGSAGTAGTGTPMLPSDGAFNGQTENLTSNTGAVPPQVDTTSWTASGSPYTIYVDAKDAANNWSSAAAASITITVTPKDVVTVSGSPP